MGDKSPKSKQKDKNQKQSKTNASDQEKRRLTDAKQLASAVQSAESKK